MVSAVEENARALDQRVREISDYIPSVARDYPAGCDASPRETSMISNVHRILYHTYPEFREHCKCRALGFRGGGVAQVGPAS